MSLNFNGETKIENQIYSLSENCTLVGTSFRTTTDYLSVIELILTIKLDMSV